MQGASRRQRIESYRGFRSLPHRENGHRLTSWWPDCSRRELPATVTVASNLRAVVSSGGTHVE